MSINNNQDSTQSQTQSQTEPKIEVLKETDKSFTDPKLAKESIEKAKSQTEKRVIFKEGKIYTLIFMEPLKYKERDLKGKFGPFKVWQWDVLDTFSETPKTVEFTKADIDRVQDLLWEKDYKVLKIECVKEKQPLQISGEKENPMTGKIEVDNA